MRLIDADNLLLGRTENIYGKLIPLITKNVIDNTPTVNAIPIPDGATNGDMIKAMFPQAIFSRGDFGISEYFMRMDANKIGFASLDVNWWNTPYEGGKEE